jgi:hypothetical protein
MKETSLHAAIKEKYVQPGDQVEKWLAGYIVDLLRGDLVIEIQTGNFINLKAKLANLLPFYQVRIVYPVPVERYIVRIDNKTGELISKRKSPKKTGDEDLFRELIYIVPFLTHENLSYDILNVKDEVIYLNDGKGSWRRNRWSIVDRKLIEIEKIIPLSNSFDLIRYLPTNIPDLFTTRDVWLATRLPMSLTRKMLYCFYQMGKLKRAGKSGKFWLYSRVH